MVALLIGVEVGVKRGAIGVDNGVDGLLSTLDAAGVRASINPDVALIKGGVLSGEGSTIEAADVR